MNRRFVLLDRDGTLIAERHYLADPQGVELLPGVTAGLRQLRQLGLGLVVITNQSGVGRGYFNMKQVERVHQRLGKLLEAEEVLLDGIYCCPHVPEEGCHCRKPAPGLVEQAVQELGFDSHESFVIGDKVCDIELGQRVGATTFLVRTGYGAQVADTNIVAPDYVVEGIGEVVHLIERLIITAA